MPKRRPKAEDWEDSAGLLLIQSWAQQGLSLRQIGKEMGRVRGVEVAESTIRKWCRVHPATIGVAITNGREVSIAQVENSLYKKAVNGDLGAICFYLKNKAPDRWSEHPELRGMSGKVVFIDDIPSQKPPEPAAEQQPGGKAEQPDNP